MRLLLAAPAVLAFLSGCTTAPDRGDGNDSGTPDAGPSRTDGGPPAGTDGGTPGACSCEVTFTHPKGSASTCELRGDFRLDGWKAGAAMSAQGDRFEITLPLEHRRVVTYKFVVDGTWVPDPANPVQASDGYGGDNSVRYVDCSPACAEAPASRDWGDAVMYFAMVDRFANGDNSNDAPVSDVDSPANWKGGDLAGLLAKLQEGYFNRLGFNALWITSPTDNAQGRGMGDDGHWYAAYHGYWPRELDRVDAHLGDMTLLKQVVDEAHRRGIRVLLDYVMNHVHDSASVYDSHRDWFWPLNGCICGSSQCRWEDPVMNKQCWFTDYLPTFNFQVAAARDYSVGNAIWWAKQTGIDGLRLDAVKQIETSWISDLRRRATADVESGGSHFYMVGETYTGNRDEIRQYVNPATLLDGQFDFPMRAVVVDKVLHRSGSMGELGGFLSDNDRFYGSAAVMSTFLGNHDLPRAIHHAEGAPRYDTWDGVRGDRAWSNLPSLPGDRAAFERLLLGFAVLYTSPGIPLVYYGDEIGMAGSGDPDNRRFMQWSGTTDHQEYLRSRLARLAAVRAAHPALRRGQRTVLGASNDVLSCRLDSGTDRVWVVLNRGDGAAGAEGLPAGFYTDLLENSGFDAPGAVKARTAVVLVRR